jgi:hypothetical protein
LGGDWSISHGGTDPFQGMNEWVGVRLAEQLLDFEQHGRMLRKNPHLPHDEPFRSQLLAARLLPPSITVLAHFARDSRAEALQVTLMVDKVGVTGDAVKRYM